MITCIVCGCTDTEACVDEITRDRCSWIMLPTAPGVGVMHINGGGLCSFCAEERIGDLDDPAFDARLHAALDLGLMKPTDSERDAHLVELVSDYEADLFIRARRADA